MLRKIRRNMARNQLKEDGHKRINKKDPRTRVSDFQMNWKTAYVRRLQKLYSKEGKKVYAGRNES